MAIKKKYKTGDIIKVTDPAVKQFIDSNLDRQGVHQGLITSIGLLLKKESDQLWDFLRAKYGIEKETATAQRDNETGTYTILIGDKSKRYD